MSFLIGTNLDAIRAYNALSKINSQSQKAQNRLATGKRINSVADDTSGYRVAKELEALTAKQKSQLNNASSAKNYLATAETALQLMNDQLNQISAKYVDSQDPTKNKSSLADDIRAIAGEINSILKTTNFNGHNILANSDGSALTATDTFDIGGGSNLDIDFAGNSYLNVSEIQNLLSGAPIPEPGVNSFDGTLYDRNGVDAPPDINPTIRITYADDTFNEVSFSQFGFADNKNQASNLINAIESGTNIEVSRTAGIGTTEFLTLTSLDKKITKVETVSGFDITTMLGITYTWSSEGSPDNTLLSNEAEKVIQAASNLSTVQRNVQSALGRIGNLSQMADTRSSYLTESITNSTSTISRLFDADMAEEQLIATRGGISNQIATSMFSKFLSAPQQLLALFQ